MDVSGERAEQMVGSCIGFAGGGEFLMEAFNWQWVRHGLLLRAVEDSLAMLCRMNHAYTVPKLLLMPGTSGWQSLGLVASESCQRD